MAENKIRLTGIIRVLCIKPVVAEQLQNYMNNDSP